MPKKEQAEVINDLQNNSDYIILNNPLAVPKFVRKLGRGKEHALNEIYTSKIFFEIVSQLTPHHLVAEEGDYARIFLKIGDFLEASGAKKSKNFYKYIIDCVDLLQTTQVKWEDTQYNYGMSVVPFYKHEKQSGTIEIHVNKEFVRAVLAVSQNEHFSFLKKHLFRLETAQSIKIFPFLVSWRHKGVLDISLEVFKKKFGYNTEGYKIFSNLEKYVLKPAINDINAKTDLSVFYKKLGDNLDGKRPRVTGLRFFIEEKSANRQQISAPKEKPLLLIEPESSEYEGYWEMIMRVFILFEKSPIIEEVKIFLKGLSSLGPSTAILEAILYAEQEQENRKRQNKPPIESLRGFIIAGIPRGLGKGILERKADAEKKQKVITDKQRAEAVKSTELEKLINEANILLLAFRKDVNEVVRTTATEAEKEKIAEILRGQSPIYVGKTLEDFRSRTLAGTFISKFMEVFPERFAPIYADFDKPYQKIMEKIKPIDPKKVKPLGY
jgi:Initiator Replication protein